MRKLTRWTILAFAPALALLIALGGRGESPEDEPEAILDLEQLPAAVERTIDFAADIRPIFENHCQECHSADFSESGFRLDDRAMALAGGDNGPAIVPGRPEASPLLLRVSGQDEFDLMPPEDEGEPLSDDQVALIRTWIAQGAAWPDEAAGETHWAYVPPVRPPLPTVSDPGWCRSPIDSFVLARLDAEGLAPSPEADPQRLVRRVYLDLLGVSPTPEEVDAFLADPSPDAYDRLVDRLLASPRYGEHWARPWLDMARYADTQGYEKDNRRTIWRYRDWVIEAINRDLPFDEFTIEQLAGDLLPGATTSQKIATAFHRNTMTNTEGGTDNEQFRIEAIVDRVNTTFGVWQATTINCCQCHSHKYDPFTQREFYQIMAFFNQSEDADRDDESPVLQVPSIEEEIRIRQLQQEIDQLESLSDLPPGQLAAEQLEWEERLRREPPKWVALPPRQATAASGAICTISDDGSVLVTGELVDRDTYTLNITTDLSHITALRLEALPDDSLPSGGPGRAEDGGYVLSELLATATPITQEEVIRARYVRVTLLGELRTLSLAEVQVFSGPTNIATGGTATQSSEQHGGHPTRAIDGNTDSNWYAGSITHTTTETEPWWELDLGGMRAVDGVSVWNRTDGNLHGRLTGAVVTLLDEDRQVLKEDILDQPPLPSTRLAYTPTLPLEFVAASATCQPADDDEQNPYGGWPARAAVDGDRKGGQWGWSNDAQAGEAQQAVFQVGESFGDQRGTLLQIALQQQSEGGRTLGRFRISATTAEPPVWILPSDIAAIVALDSAERTDAQRQVLAHYYRSVIRDDSQRQDRIEGLRGQITGLRSTTVPIMVEGEGRTTNIHIRGSFLSKGEEVDAGTPAVLNSIDPTLPRNRLALAQWLVSGENPLTGRVVVNRHWGRIFGTGIVATSEDFGTQGAPPSHPELLDWLATELVRQEWSIKALHRLIVTSSTYRQSSHVSPELLEADPNNRLLAHGSRVRLSAEQVRDQALAAAGLLSDKMYGPGVMPPQPDGVWQVVYNGDQWVTPTGPDRYRRGLYTFWRRTSPYPSMITFDAPSREFCVLRRSPTNTPLQALVVLNDPVYLEAAAALAQRTLAEAADSPQARVTRAFRLCLGRQPEPAEVDRLVELYESELAYYRENPQLAVQLLNSANRSDEDEAEAPDLAAWTIISSVLLNLDEMLTKG